MRQIAFNALLFEIQTPLQMFTYQINIIPI